MWLPAIGLRVNIRRVVRPAPSPVELRNALIAGRGDEMLGIPAGYLPWNGGQAGTGRIGLISGLQR